MRSLPFVILVATTCVSLATERAYACSCVAREELDPANYDAVFIGTALSIARPERGPRARIFSTGDAIEVAFAVEQTWDGSTDPLRIVRTAAGESSCGAKIRIGERHLVTASNLPKDDLASLATSLCTHTGPIDETREGWLSRLPEPRLRFEHADSTVFGHAIVITNLRSKIPAVQESMHRAIRAAGPKARAVFEDLLVAAQPESEQPIFFSRQEAIATLLYIDPADPRVIDLVDRLVNRGEGGNARWLLEGIAEWQWARAPGRRWEEDYRILLVTDLSPAWDGILPEPESFLDERWSLPYAYLMFARHFDEPTTTLAGDPIAPERAVALLREGLRVRAVEAWEHMYPELVSGSLLWDPVELAGFIEDALDDPRTRQRALDFAELVPEIGVEVRIQVPGAPVIEGKWRVDREEW